MDGLVLRTSEHPLARFANMHDKVDPLWGNCRHPYPLKHAFAEHLAEAYADYRYRKAHGLPLADRPPASTLAQAVAALDTLPDPRIAQVIRACCFAADGTTLPRTTRLTEQAMAARLGISRQMVSKLKRQGLAHLDRWTKDGVSNGCGVRTHL